MSDKEKSDAETERREAIQHPGTAAPETLGPGVVLRPLVGAHNHAHQLFTSLVTIDPGAGIPYITRPCCAAVTLLEGEVVVEVEGLTISSGARLHPNSGGIAGRSIRPIATAARGPRVDIHWWW